MGIALCTLQALSDFWKITLLLWDGTNGFHPK